MFFGKVCEQQTHQICDSRVESSRLIYANKGIKKFSIFSELKMSHHRADSSQVTGQHDHWEMGSFLATALLAKKSFLIPNPFCVDSTARD